MVLSAMRAASGKLSHSVKTTWFKGLERGFQKAALNKQKREKFTIRYPLLLVRVVHYV